jgi:hypothetical protein
LFYTEGNVGLAAPRFVSIPLDVGSFANDRLLHVRARVKPDFPALTSETVVMEPFTESYAGNLSDLGGLRHAIVTRGDGQFDLTAFGRVDPGKIFVGVFLRSDSNEDAAVDLTDQINILSYLFRGTFHPSCLDALDVNDDEEVDLIDPMYGLTFLFNTGRNIPAPFPICDKDLTPVDAANNRLGCNFYCPEKCEDPSGFCIPPSGFGF